MDELKQMAAMAALNDMMAKNYVSICTIDNVAKMLNVNPRCPEYDVLHALHCVSFDRVPKELLDKVPALIAKALSGDRIFQFDIESIAGKPTFNMKELPR